MPKCFVLGGIGESALSTPAPLNELVWIELGILMRGQTGKLRLAANGIDPGPPDGVALESTGPIAPYLGLPATILAAQLLGRNYSTRTFPWDWRKSIYAAGVALANVIRAEVTTADPCALVAHSAGGLVCRAAWTELGLTNEHALVRRIVTLGTPHWGSYSVVSYFQGNNASIRWLEYANQELGRNTFGRAPDVFGYVYRETLFYRQLGLTWPAFYDLFPVLGAPDAAADPHRELLYTATNWPAEARPQQTWLDHAKNVTGPWLRSAASKPPPEVLTCISGEGYSLASQLTDPSGFAEGSGLGGYVDGDNAVTLASAQLSGSAIVRYGINHENLMPTLANSGQLASAVTEIREPGPAPSPEQSPDPQTTNVGILPFAQTPNLGIPSAVCAAGGCIC